MERANPDGLLGEILVAMGLLNSDELKSALSHQAATGELIGSTLVRLGYLSEDAMLKGLGLQYGVAVASGIPAGPPAGVRRPPERFMKEHCVFPFEASGGKVRVATAMPQDSYPLEAISALSGLRAEPVICAPQEIMKAIEASAGGAPVSVGSIIEGISEKDASVVEDDIEELKGMAGEAPIVNLVNILISRAAAQRASDIHIEPFEGAVAARYRVDGMLCHAESIPRKLHPAIVSRVKIMARLNIAERRLPQDGRIKHRWEGGELDIRVSTVPTLYGEGVVMRLLDPRGSITLKGLGLPSGSLEAFSAIIRQPYGMMLVTGPTGSGKTTTLYAALSAINAAEKKVITVEDPVEYHLDGVNQIQVKPKIGFTFANGLRSIVRQDPDVIMVGEIRDAETAGIAVHAALTGHLIMSTLHTNDAPGAVARLLEMGVEGYLLSSSLIGVMAQRLVRVVCGRCSTARRPTEKEAAEMAAELERLSIDPGAAELRSPNGCAECNNTGYLGRTGIFELMPVTDSLREVIGTKGGSAAIRRAAVQEGMRTLRQDGWAKALAGVTTVEEVERVTVEAQAWRHTTTA